MGSQFRFSIDNFRGLAILFVMLSHISYFRPMGRAGDYGYFTVGDATSWFVFISGYLFYYIESGKFQYWSYLVKKIKFVFLPYLLVSLPAVLAGLYFSRHILLGLSALRYSIWSLLVGGAVVGPLWFIPMIVIFFLMSPLWQKIASSSWTNVFALAGIGFSLLSSRPIGDMNPFLSFFHFSGFYLLGVAFAKNSRVLDKVRSSWVSPMLMLGGVAGFLYAAHIYDETDNELHGFFDLLGTFNALQFGKLSLLVALFFFFERFVNRKNSFFAYFAKISFGLFFIHGFYVVLFAKLMQRWFVVNPLVSLMAEMALVLIGSVLTVALVKKLLGARSRYVIGC